MAQHAPNPALFGSQNWEQPADLPVGRAKQLHQKRRGAKTKALHKEDTFLLVKINSVIQQAHTEWPQLRSVNKEMTDDLIAQGQANSTHFILLHKPTGLLNGETDKEAIQCN